MEEPVQFNNLESDLQKLNIVQKCDFFRKQVFGFIKMNKRTVFFIR